MRMNKNRRSFQEIELWNRLRYIKNLSIVKLDLYRFGFRIDFKPVNKVCFPLPKDPILSLDRWGVYRIPCECGLAYIGQTKRALKLRVGEHKRFVSKQKVSKSSVSEHSWNAGHVFQFYNTKILFTPQYISELDFLDASAIFIHSHSLMNDNVPFVSSAWKPLLLKV